MLIPPIKREEVIPIQDKLVPRTYICATDSRFNYTFCKEEDIIENNNLPEIIDRSMIDYGVVVKKGEAQTEGYVGSLDEVKPLSYTCCKTKKSIKQETKKVKKNPRKPIPQGLSCIKKKFSLSFE